MDQLLSNVIEMGGVGILAVLMFVQNREHQRQDNKRQEALDKEMLALVRNNTSVMQQMVDATREQNEILRQQVNTLYSRSCLLDEDSVRKKLRGEG